MTTNFVISKAIINLQFSCLLQTIGEILNKHILLLKSDHYSISGFSFFGIQYICFNKVEPDKEHSTAGIPEGSSLDTLLLLTYIND